uniref:Nedd4 family interacting protein 1 n=1 Tax=Astatotilapia calliptera TaxID=8154 RepID=A0A3P8PJM3_ASTCA
MAESSPRYQQLTNEEDSEESPQVAADAPPPYSSVTADNSAFFDCKEDGIFPKPPSYNVATTLPSYDEAERTKAETNVPLVPGRDEDFVTRDDFEDADQLRIGNDGIFMLTFFMAFLFNWIGFFLSFCLTTSAAGRYGAISGFGLSLVKWILIVRFSAYFSNYFDGQYWLWWVFLVLDSTRCRKHSLEILVNTGCKDWSFYPHLWHQQTIFVLGPGAYRILSLFWTL